MAGRAGGGLPGWNERYGPAGPWDFSPDALDRLGALVAAETPTLADLRDPAQAAFVSGAVWYFGETLRRNYGGTGV